ncbi:RNA binding domain protein [Exophiala viscosa]|uniref:RNA binding domain protein n=1 Tax=Exophiala viscosa TaxID=2486360 RepID=UPI0021959B24|nr:RNA binding domain protein [Exophiala viscosa]
MNAIRQTQQLNKRELENATPPSASWHADYRDTAYIYVGGLNPDLTEGDVVTIFSQFGNPTHLNLIRDKETGKSKGFAFLKYEDQRSCDLAVDNLTGADVVGRLLRVDHTRYKKKDDEDEDTHRIDRLEQQAELELNGNGKRGSDDTEDEDEESRHKRKRRRPMLKEEQELEEMLAIKQDGEVDDPMREYLINEKREEVERAKQRQEEKERRSKDKHRHRRREGHDDDGERHPLKGRDDQDEDQEAKRHRHRRRDEEDDRKDERPRRHRREDEDENDEKSHRHRDREGDRDRHDRDRRRPTEDDSTSMETGTRIVTEVGEKVAETGGRHEIEKIIETL